MNMIQRPYCTDKRHCFARELSRCKILKESYGENRCPFCKPYVDVTKGKAYPFNPNYGSLQKL